MVKNPLFTVVIPTYNHSHLIKRCLDSVMDQSIDNWEAIVINNYSKDNTIEVVESYNDSRIRLINNSNNGVIAVSRNKGISEAKGEWICFLDSDDWWTPNKLESCLPFLNDFDIIYHDLFMYNSKGQVYGRKIHGRKLSANITRDLIVNGNAIPNSSVAVRAEFIRKIEGFSEKKELIAVEDSDCWVRLSEITNRFKYLPRSLGYYWIGDNISVSIKQIDRELELFKHHTTNINSMEQKDALKNISYKQARIYHKLGINNKARIKYRESLSIRYFKRSIFAISLFLITFFSNSKQN
ncbi:MAG: glycosyltransferase [Paludibacter sp.]|nr:glycosyltransferase [Paludibacter sp.]